MENAEDYQLILVADVHPIDHDVGQLRHDELARAVFAPGMSQAR